MTVERDYDKTIAQYEEDDPGTRVYKFDHPTTGETGWSPVGPDDYDAYSRVLGGRIQFFHFDEGVPPGDRDELEAFLRSLAPLDADGVVEIWIGKDHGGWFVRDYRFEKNGPIVCDLPALTREHMKAAAERVMDLAWED